MAGNKSAAAKVLAAWAEQRGGTLDLSALANLGKSREEHTREAESVMRSLHKPHTYITKKCKRKQCGEVFRTNYCGVAYCSDACLAADMRAIGISWDPFKDRNESSMYASDSGIKWRYEPPEYISTETLNQLETVFRSFLADLDRLREVADQVETEQTERMLASPLLDWDSPDEAVPSSEDDPEDQPEPEPLQVPSLEQDNDFLTTFLEPLEGLDQDFFA